jgi:ribosomal protein S18 acetylase RimI-like enzyme
MTIDLEEIGIRHTFRTGDIGYIIYLHGNLYAAEYNHGIEFETYVAEGLLEFYKRFDPQKDRIWICEHNHKIIGFLLLMHRGDTPRRTAQLRYFLIHPDYRGIGLGKKLMNLFMDFFHRSRYTAAYLLTTHELEAAASLYRRHGFRLTEEVESSAFGKPVREQRYEFITNR